MNHILYSVEELQAVFGGSSLIHRADASIRTILTDSRKITDAGQALYFAIKGRRDGMVYIPEVYRGGGRSFVIADPAFDTSRFPEANFYLVDNTLTALQQLAAHHRSRFQYPVIGITGSNGKTVVKEWLFQLLSPEYHVVRSPKSYNSQIGVPVSVWEMGRENTLGIFEAGISQTGEMENLTRIIQPGIGILTNLGEAHQEGFLSREEKLTEKLKLFRDVELFIYPAKYLEGYKQLIPGRKQFTWAYSQKSDLEIIDEALFDTKFKRIKARFKGQEIQVTIPFTDHASVENGINCWATLLALGYEPQEIEVRLKKLLPVNMRLELKNGINNCSIIDDSYSLDLSSLAIALDFLKQQNQHPKRTLILSDMPDLSTDQGMLYAKVAALLENKSVDRLIGVGRQIRQYAGQFPMETLFFETTDELLEKTASLKFFNETILLKGARSFEFERISKVISQKVHETVLEINLSALEHNLNFYKSHLKPGVKLMAMVKAFSYGSGSFEIANLLEFNKVDYLAVAYADEGVS
ncbi:MAG TPA: Mur ligase family protein, partial [Daejeonella sp.]|nr:Mur ligase family protein [Daejeonella sp.]